MERPIEAAGPIDTPPMERLTTSVVQPDGDTKEHGMAKDDDGQLQTLPARRRTGRPTKYRDEYAKQAFKLCLLGATDEQLADFFEVGLATIKRWRSQHEEFRAVLTQGKQAADAKVAEALYRQALSGNVTACIFWLKNRRPHEWRDRHNLEHSGADGAPVTLVAVWGGEQPPQS